MNPTAPISNSVDKKNDPRRSDDAIARPVGVFQPDDPVARRLLAALADARIEDAEAHLRRMREVASTQAERAAPGRVWTYVLEAMVAEAGGRLGESERWSAAAAALAGAEKRDAVASEDGSQSPANSARDDARVRALALECLGRVLRRMDDPLRADEAHRASLEIRERVGSWEECRRSAHELALDASVAGRHDDAIAWHRRALEFAVALGDAGLFLRVESLSHLARVLRDTGRFDAAIQQAQESLELRNRFDPSSLETLRAALELAECRLAQAAALATEASATPAEATPRAASPVGTAITELSELYKELLAWGVGVEDEVERCTEALDFARRLHESSAAP